MNISKELLLNQASATGFRAEILEKVFHLFQLLEGFRDHPALKGKLVLKGGTALNLFIFDVPRLSVDIDLNYVGEAELEAMQKNRPDIERAIIAVCERSGFAVKRIPSVHAGGKWRLQYGGALGQGGALEIDVNFLLRVPLWPVQMKDSREVGAFKVTGISLLDFHELAAGKLAALFSRCTSRDLFDAWHLMMLPEIDIKKLRLGFVVYAGFNRKDFRTVSIDEVSFDTDELKHRLIPVLGEQETIRRGDVKIWTRKIVDDCRERLTLILPFRPNEMEFLEALNGTGEINPELLSEDSILQSRIKSHPALRWKAFNVKSYVKGGGG